MNGMILYPTDDEIIVLKEAILNIEAEEAKTWQDGTKLFLEAWNLSWWRIIFELKPLKINETVLG